jgi:hypothetical protein
LVAGLRGGFAECVKLAGALGACGLAREKFLKCTVPRLLAFAVSVCPFGGLVGGFPPWVVCAARRCVCGPSCLLCWNVPRQNDSRLRRLLGSTRVEVAFARWETEICEHRFDDLVILGNLMMEDSPEILPLADPYDPWAGEDEDVGLGPDLPDIPPAAVPKSWQDAWARCWSLLTKAGLTGSKLALQVGDEEELLEQLLSEMSYEAQPAEQYWLTSRLTKKIEEAVLVEPLAKRLRGEFKSLAYQRIDDAVAAAGQRPPALKVIDLSNTLPRKGSRRSAIFGDEKAGDAARTLHVLYSHLERLMVAAAMPAIEMLIGS